jgi:hypothetical protein
MRLDAAVDEHVARHELLDAQLLDAGCRGQLHTGVEGDQRGRGVARIHRIAQPTTHSGVIVTIVPDGAVTEVPAVPPTGIAAPQILTPDFLEQVAPQCRGIAELGRRDHPDRQSEHRVFLRHQVGRHNLR